MKIHEILKEHWGYDKFRPLQQEIIESVIAGEDTLALLPTGGGKSICFQVPGLFLSGTTLVVSPLIALMKDQVQNLKSKGIRAEAIYAGIGYRKMNEIIDTCIHGDIKFLYVSPERLSNDTFRSRLKQVKLNFIAVDEAHCISQWGYDFRPPYLRISEVRDLFPNIPVIALTATATTKVVDDIQEKLKFKKKKAYRKSFVRKNLGYIVNEEENKKEKLLKLLQSSTGSAVVYVRNRAKTQSISEFLNGEGIKSGYYHAGLSNEMRDERQLAWINNELRVIVATNAFGMGIDKPDVRMVVHLDLPDSLEAYFQEAGRAGRDEKQAYAIALWNNADILDLEKYYHDAYPPVDAIARLYIAVCNYLQIAELSGSDTSHLIYPDTFLNDFNISAVLFFNGIKFLERQGLMAFSDVKNSFPKVHFHRDDLKYDDYTTQQADLLKALLRNYEGLFDGYVRVNEKLLANRIDVKHEKVIEELKSLHQSGVIKYQWPRKGFTITLLQDRVPQQFFNLSSASYADRKKVAREKIDGVIKYIKRKDKCRNRLLLEYFGELKATNCGECDYCRNNIQEHKADSNYANLLVFLSKYQGSEIELLDLYKQQPAVKEHSGSLLRWGIDKGLLTLLPGNKLFINKKKVKHLLG